MFYIVLTVLGCLSISAFCSVTEASFYSVTPAAIESLQKQKKFTARYMVHVKENIDRYIASVLVVNTIANTVGASLATALAVKNLPPAGQVALPIILTILILLFGEITPKTISTRCPDRIAYALSGIITVFCFILHPVIVIVTCISRGILRLCGIKPEKSSQAYTAEEMKTFFDNKANLFLMPDKI